ncbi:MAG: META domain-containing protein, partial [Anaerolineae bacterium]|nr:META domain-containing protein [Anaerolineae bacterium]
TESSTTALPAVTLFFGSDNRAYGNASCNQYGTAYSINEGRIAFDLPMSTMMACMEDGVMEQELAYMSALGTVTSYEIVNNQLILTYEGGQLVFDSLALANSEWILVSYGTLDAPVTPIAEAPITLKFADDGTVAGSGGCNSYSSGYTLVDSAITFDAVISTEMACMTDGVMAQESAYYGALASATLISKQTVDSLVIDYGENTGEQLTFKRVHNLGNTAWQLVSFDDETPVVENSIVTIIFNADGTMGGSGGCNSYGGTYVVNGDAIDFNDVASTMMACVDDNITAQEGSFFFGLEKATTFEISATELVIYYGEGAKMTFTRIENPNSE